MDKIYECLVDERLILEKVKSFLEPLIDDSANWNNNRYGYIYALMYRDLENTELSPSDHIGAWVDIAFNVFSSIARLKDRCRPIYPSVNTNPKARCARVVCCIIIELLASNKLVRFHTVTAPKYALTENIVKSGLFNTLSRVVRFFSYISTSYNYEAYKQYLSEEERDTFEKAINLVGAKAATWANCAAQYRRFIFHNGISSFNEITAQGLIEYKKLLASRGSAISFNTLLPLASSISGNDLSSVVGSSTTGKGSPSISDSGDTFDVFRTTAAFKLCGVKGVTVKYKRVQGKPVNIGEWSYMKNAVLDHSPRILVESCANVWVQSQLEYITNGKFEKGTQKHIEKAFSIVNIYLLSYLPHFFSKYDVPYPYPEKPKDFHGFIYVSPSPLLTKHFYNTESLKLPVNLIDFIKAFLRTDSINGGANTIRDAVGRIQRYFQWIRDRFSAIEDFNLTTNPITKEDKRSIQGISYQRSNKKKFDYEYWMLFKEFVKAVADKLVTEAESATESVKGGLIAVDRDVSFANLELHIGTVDISYFPKVNLEGNNDAIIKALPYQQYCALLFMASCGLRLSNVMWLDARTFDQHYSPAPGDDYGTAWVNTDKAADDPYESSVPTDVMELALRVKALRPRVYKIAQTPMPYQSNKESKWGEILPLFQFVRNNQHDTISTNLANITREFEIVLAQNGIEFNSELMYVPHHIPIQEFLMLKRNNILVNDKRHIVICDVKGEDQEAYFTPIQFKTELTPHSLRKTFDSYMSVLCGNEATGKIFTGQTDATVGYYTENTPEEELQIKGQLAQMGIPSPVAQQVVNLNSVAQDVDAVIATLKKNGIAGINGFTLARIRKPSDDIDQAIAVAAPSDIAVNRTHICLYNNECPNHILDRLERKRNCALCPQAIGSEHDGPAIAATIKHHCDRIIEINSMLGGDKLNKREREQLIQERVDKTMLACSWLIRLEHINNHLIGGDSLVVLGDGADAANARLNYVMPKSKSEAAIARFQEVEGISTLQSGRLKKTAERMSRKLLKVLSNGDVELPEADEIEVAVSLIKKIAATQQLDIAQVADLIESYDQKQQLQSSAILNVLELINE